jgi:2-oxoglutarate dehydrogenase E1 component
MTPKSLLRSPNAAATVDELTSGAFHTVVTKDFVSDGASPEHIVFCSGKVVYDIEQSLESLDSPSVRIIRLEQLYPFPQAEIAAAIEGISPKSVTWVQEEPRNMGAWFFIEPFLKQKFGLDVSYAGRALSASTATGSSKRHVYETHEFLKHLQENLLSK